MAYAATGGGGAGIGYDPIYDALGNIRGMASDGRTNKEKTGQIPITEKAQDTAESIVINVVSGGATVLDLLANNWKLILIAVVGLLIVLKD